MQTVGFEPALQWLLVQAITLNLLATCRSSSVVVAICDRSTAELRLHNSQPDFHWGCVPSGTWYTEPFLRDKAYARKGTARYKQCMVQAVGIEPKLGRP